ncbi:hypothetical protein BC833DRAFT_84698 [Globomyces pollinis-pini]|nr:hypothetical protein BC833DRAFT_84698 [Globomyces pollinis-pini]
MGSMDIKNLIKNLESIDPIHSYPSQIQLLEYYKHNPANFNQDLESNQFNYKSPNTMNLIHLFCKYNRINQISTPTLYQFYSILMTLEFNIIINEYFHLCVFLDILKFWSLQSTSKSELYSIQYGKLYKPWSKKVQSQSQLICDLLLVNDNDIVLKSTQILLLLLNNPNLDLVISPFMSISVYLKIYTPRIF